MHVKFLLVAMLFAIVAWKPAESVRFFNFNGRIHLAEY